VGTNIPPGCCWWAPDGKEPLLARQSPAERVPSLALKASDLLRLSRVGPAVSRDLFKRAKENSPCLFFIRRNRLRGTQTFVPGWWRNDDYRNRTLSPTAPLKWMLGREVPGIHHHSRPPAALRCPRFRRAACARGRSTRQVSVDAPDHQLDRLFDLLRSHFPQQV